MQCALSVCLLTCIALRCATIEPGALPDPAHDETLYSAFLLRESGRMHADPPATEQERIALLRQHFAAIDALLVRDAQTSLDLALAVESSSVRHWGFRIRL